MSYNVLSFGSLCFLTNYPTCVWLIITHLVPKKLCRNSVVSSSEELGIRSRRASGTCPRRICFLRRSLVFSKEHEMFIGKILGVPWKIPSKLGKINENIWKSWDFPWKQQQMGFHGKLPSGKHTKDYGKSPCFIGFSQRTKGAISNSSDYQSALEGFLQ